MASPSNGYYLNGVKVPSVTTIIGVGLGGYSKDALMHWSWKLGKEGVDYKKARDKSATVGTIAHARIEAFLNDVVPDLSAYDSALIVQSTPCLDAFMEWYYANDIEVHEQEVQLISELHGYGGCFDARITLNGVMCLADWKSSSNIYGSMVAQVAAYQGLIRENRRRDQWPHNAVIVRIGKDGVLRVVELSIADLNYGFKVFLNALAVYQARRKLDQMVAVPFEPQESVPSNRYTITLAAS